MKDNPNFLNAEDVKAFVDDLLKNPTEDLLRWGKDQGLDVKYVAHPNWGSLKQWLDRNGLWEASKAYMEQEVHDLVAEYRVTTRPRVAKQIVIRFLKDRIMRSHDVARRLGQVGDDPELALIPAHMRWAFNHPALAVSEEDANDPVLKAFARAYERKTPAPSNGALNLFFAAQGDTKARDKLFSDVATMIKQERTKKKEAGARHDEDPLIAEAELFEAEMSEMLRGLNGAS